MNIGANISQSRLFHTIRVSAGADSTLIPQDGSIGIGFPGWKLKVWTLREIREILPLCITKNHLVSPYLGMRVKLELLACEIIRLFGGAYADRETLFFRSLEEIIIDDCTHLAFDRGNRISVDILVAPAYSSFLSDFLADCNWVLGKTKIFKCAGLRLARHDIDLHYFLSRWLKGKRGCREVRGDGGLLAGWIYNKADLFIWSKDVMDLHPRTSITCHHLPNKELFNKFASRRWSGTWMGEFIEL